MRIREPRTGIRHFVVITFTITLFRRDTDISFGIQTKTKEITYDITLSRTASATCLLIEKD